MARKEDTTLIYLGFGLLAILFLTALAPSRKVLRKVRVEAGKLYQVTATIKDTPSPESMKAELEKYTDVKDLTITEQADGTKLVVLDFISQGDGTLELDTFKMFGAELNIISLKPCVVS